MTGKELVKKFEYYNRRVDFLWSKRQRVEALLYMSLLVEMLAKDAILTFGLNGTFVRL